MLVNSSSVSIASHPSPSSSSSSISIFCYLYSCFNSTDGAFSITAFTITSNFFLLPLYILVLYLGHQRWRQQRLGTTMSHSDFLTYNMVAAELLSVTGFTLLCFGVYTDLIPVMMVGTFLSMINLNGQMLFHIMTCVERYLAVIHPVTYLSLRKAKGIRIRNISIACVWLVCFQSGLNLYQDYNISAVSIYFCSVFLSIVVISFCSLSVLRVLIRPGPGDGVGGRQQRVDQSKLRAFYTIIAILAVLLVKSGGIVLSAALYMSQLGEAAKCGVWLGLAWFSLPSSLVLPLLFLQRAGKLVCCKNVN